MASEPLNIEASTEVFLSAAFEDAPHIIEKLRKELGDNIIRDDMTLGEAQKVMRSAQVSEGASPSLTELMFELYLAERRLDAVRLQKALLETSIEVKKTSEVVEKTSKEVKRTSEEVEKTTKAVRALADNFQGHRKTVADGLEFEMANGICKLLEGGTIVQVSYKWAHAMDGIINETDAIVTGVLHGKKVLVIGEAKLNMEKEWYAATQQVQNSRERWRMLCEEFQTMRRGEQISEEDRRDIEALKVEEFYHLEVVLALGGLKFPESLKTKITKRLGGKQWLYARKIAEAIHVEEVVTVQRLYDH